MAKRRGKILLCKGSPGENESQESYKAVLETAGYFCEFLPALQFEFTSLAKLRDCLTTPHSFSGLILTSPRSVESINAATNEDFASWECWKTMPVYCIGPTTTSLAKDCLHFTNCLGGESGNSKELAEFIIKNTQVGAAPLLYPCSEIARDTVERILTNNNVAIKKLVTYRTLTSETLEKDFEIAIKDPPVVVVFFSPSVVECVLPLLCKEKNVIGNVKLIAIGPVTGETLIKMGVKTDAISEKPEPLALLKAVESCVNSTDF